MKGNFYHFLIFIFFAIKKIVLLKFKFEKSFTEQIM